MTTAVKQINEEPLKNKVKYIRVIKRTEESVYLLFSRKIFAESGKTRKETFLNTMFYVSS